MNRTEKEKSAYKFSFEDIKFNLRRDMKHALYYLFVESFFKSFNIDGKKKGSKKGKKDQKRSQGRGKVVQNLVHRGINLILPYGTRKSILVSADFIISRILVFKKEKTPSIKKAWNLYITNVCIGISITYSIFLKFLMFHYSG